VRARLTAGTLLALAALALPPVAEGTGWSAPSRVASRPSSGLVIPWYAQSPNGRRTDLVVADYREPDIVYPISPGGRLGRPWRVPLKLGATDADLSLNDAGATALAWAVDAPNPTPDQEGTCWCQVRAVVRQPNGRFGPATTLTEPAQVTALGSTIAPDGSATVFSSEWHPERAEEPLSVAEAAPRGRFSRARTIVPSVLDFAVDSVRGRPLLLYEERGRPGQQLALAPPYATAQPVGSLSSGDPFARGDVAGDGRGNELIVNADIAISHRSAGGTFAPFRQFAKPSGTDCGMTMRMNSRIAVAAWNCGDNNQGQAQVAVLSPRGRLLRLSRSRTVYPGGEAPTLALDRNGRWVAAFREDFQTNGFVALSGRGKHPDPWRRIVARSRQLQAPDVAILRGGIAHAAWVDDPGKRAFVVESRLRIGTQPR
jgi:hypothetical protein